MSIDCLQYILADNLPGSPDYPRMKPVYSQYYRGYAARAHEPEKDLLKIGEEESHLSSEELGRKKLLARG